MRHDNIRIRSMEELESARPEIKKALLSEAANPVKKEFPLVYQYLGGATVQTQYNINPSDVIGTVNNIRSDGTAIVCDITTTDVVRKASNFTGVVDNVVVGVSGHPSKKKGDALLPELISVVVYDKFAKSVIDQKNQDSNRSTYMKGDSPVEGCVANDKTDNPLKNPEIVAAIRNDLGRGGGIVC